MTPTSHKHSEATNIISFLNNLLFFSFKQSQVVIPMLVCRDSWTTSHKQSEFTNPIFGFIMSILFNTSNLRFQPLPFSPGQVSCSQLRTRRFFDVLAWCFLDRDRILGAFESCLRQGLFFGWLHSVSSAGVAFWAH